jgi:hypothetical protein
MLKQDQCLHMLTMFCKSTRFFVVKMVDGNARNAIELMHGWVEQFGCHTNELYLVIAITMPMLFYRS